MRTSNGNVKNTSKDSSGSAMKHGLDLQMKSSPILKLKQVKENAYGYERIDIVHFNFDGEGSALVYCYHEKEKHLASFRGKDLYRILIGDPGSGDIYYKEICDNLQG